MDDLQNLVGRMLSLRFFLGGSRRMAEKYPDDIQVSPDTDYDFYVEDSDTARHWLEHNGFKLIDATNRNYWDGLLVDMYKHESLPIECLIRSDVKKYSQCFESISAEDFKTKLWKSAPGAQIENKAAFRAGVCAYFNNLFYGISNPINDLPF